MGLVDNSCKVGEKILSIFVQKGYAQYANDLNIKMHL